MQFLAAFDVPVHVFLLPLSDGVCDAGFAVFPNPCSVYGEFWYLHVNCLSVASDVGHVSMLHVHPTGGRKKIK